MALSKLQLSELLATYRDLLTDNQIGVLSMYCDCDCSLAEIAAETGISRQGVRDAVVKGRLEASDRHVRRHCRTDCSDGLRDCFWRHSLPEGGDCGLVLTGR